MLPTPESDETGEAEPAEDEGTASPVPPPERRAPGPRRRLSRELIVDTAIELVETRGLGALSMRGLAERLGVAPGTLYTYVANRTTLETLILDTVISRDKLPHELPGTWLEKLEAWARDDWTAFREHPWVLELRRANHDFGPSTVTWLDSALRVFDGTGLPAQVKFDMIDTLDAYVRGAATVDLQSTDREPEPDPATFGELDEAHLKAPALVRALASGATPVSTSRFDFGLRCLLAGFRVIAEPYSEEPG